MKVLRPWSTYRVIQHGKETDEWFPVAEFRQEIFSLERQMEKMFDPEDVQKIVRERDRALRTVFLYERALREIGAAVGVYFKHDSADRACDTFQREVVSKIKSTEENHDHQGSISKSSR